MTTLPSSRFQPQALRSSVELGLECRKKWRLRCDAVVSPEAGEYLDVREVNLLQGLRKPLLGEENSSVGGVLGVYPVLGRDEELDTGRFSNLSQDLLLVYDHGADGAEHNLDVLEDAVERAFVRVVDLNELCPLGEPFGVLSFYRFLLQRKGENWIIEGYCDGGLGLTDRERILRVLTLPEALYLRSSSMIHAPMAPAPITTKLEDIFVRDKLGEGGGTGTKSGNEKSL